MRACGEDRQSDRFREMHLVDVVYFGWLFYNRGMWVQGRKKLKSVCFEKYSGFAAAGSLGVAVEASVDSRGELVDNRHKSDLTQL